MKEHKRSLEVAWDPKLGRMIMRPWIGQNDNKTGQKLAIIHFATSENKWFFRGLNRINNSDITLKLYFVKKQNFLNGIAFRLYDKILFCNAGK